MKKFSGKWGFYELYYYCTDYLNNQTGPKAIELIERLKDFERKYPIIKVD
jgi:hypothetical protein